MRTVDEMLTEHRDVIARATADSRAIVTRAVEDAKRYRVGSPEAIADCQQRRETAIQHAQHEIDRDQEIADRLVNGAASDARVCDYDPTDDEGGD